MNGYKVKPPDQEEYKHSDDIYEKRLLVWEHLTPAPEEKIRKSVVFIFPINNRNLPRDLCDKFFEQIKSNALVCVWKEFEDSFFSKCECCYTAVVAISTLDNMRSYLKRIPGGCPGTKNSKLAVQVKDEPSFEEEMVRVWEEFEDCSRGGDNTDALISNFKSC